MTNVKTLILTRPEAQSRALAKDIDANFPEKARCIIAPLMAIKHVGALPDTRHIQAILFTSINGVKAFFAVGGALTVPCYCVGERTATAAREVGFNAKSSNGTAADLVVMVAKDLKPEDGALLYVRGEIATGDVADKLVECGFLVTSKVLYEQKGRDFLPVTLDAIAQGEVNAFPLYSPLTARRLAAVFADNPAWPKHDITALCISDNVAFELQNLTFASVQVAEEPNGAAMLTLIGQFLR